MSTYKPCRHIHNDSYHVTCVKQINHFICRRAAAGHADRGLGDLRLLGSEHLQQPNRAAQQRRHVRRHDHLILPRRRRRRQRRHGTQPIASALRLSHARIQRVARPVLPAALRGEELETLLREWLVPCADSEAEEEELRDEVVASCVGEGVDEGERGGDVVEGDVCGEDSAEELAGVGRGTVGGEGWVEGELAPRYDLVVFLRLV